MAKRRARAQQKRWQRGGIAGGILVALLCLVLCIFGMNPELAAQIAGGELSEVIAELYGGGQLAPQPLFPDSSGGSAAPLPAGQFELHMIDVGQGLSVLLRSPEGACALIDAGDRGAEEVICPYLRELGVTELDLVVATHMHADHIGGMDEVIREFGGKRVIMPDMPKSITPTTKSYTDLLSAIEDKGCRITLAKPGAEYPLGSAVLTVLGPVSGYDDLNNTSVVTRIRYGEAAFLVTGDAEEVSEQDMLDSRRVQPAQVLIAGHHGSSTSSSAAFLSAVKPSYIGISCGEDNSYGHPHREAMQRFQKAGATILRTDLSGTVVFYTDGAALGAQVERS